MTSNDEQHAPLWAALPGPWNDEPNEWRGELHGLPVVAVRDTHFGNWCGYAGIGEAHALHGIGFADEVPAPYNWQSNRINPDELGVMNVFLAALGHALNGPTPGHAPLAMLLSAHHGLSYAGRLKGYGETWFFGFDCGHAGDYQPGMVASLLDSAGRAPSPLIRARLRANLYARAGVSPEARGEVYRSLEYVQHILAHLADQLAGWGHTASQTAAEAIKKASENTSNDT